MEQKLELTFLNTAGSKVRVTVPNADDTLESTDIKIAMDAIIAHNVLAPGGFDLASADSARIVSTSVVAYEYAV